MEFKKVSELLKLTFVDSIRFSDQVVYNQAVRLLGNKELANVFMTSNFGGYPTHKIKKFERNYHRF